MHRPWRPKDRRCCSRSAMDRHIHSGGKWAGPLPVLRMAHVSVCSPIKSWHKSGTLAGIMTSAHCQVAALDRSEESRDWRITLDRGRYRRGRLPGERVQERTPHAVPLSAEALGINQDGATPRARPLELEMPFHNLH